jgi:phosphopantothenoylcysteine decarboxylase/phosphopantothenate--cysteine ligase
MLFASFHCTLRLFRRLPSETADSMLKNKHIVLGITSGIAAYKAPMLVRALTAAGAEVQVVLSENAHRFVSPLSLQAVSGHPVRQSLWDEAAEAAMGHIELARWADAIVIAPATANCIAHLAQGRAPDLLGTLCLATQAPIVVAPAMNQQMFSHPTTQRNLDELNSIGYLIVGPDAGEQACGDVGLGRMTEPEEITNYLCQLFVPPYLANLTVMVTTGPTMEAIDPVRFISNHSSGRQGLAIAQAASEAGASVHLVAGPGVSASASHIQRTDVVTALDMYQAVHDNLAGVDIFVGVAAVADYRPAEVADQKMKRSGEKDAQIQINLIENPDIIASVANLADKPLVVGFAAETNDALAHGSAKRKRKGLDAIVVNDVSNPNIGFHGDHNAATLIHEHGEVVFPRQPKKQLAVNLLHNIGEIFANKFVSAQSKSMTK